MKLVWAVALAVVAASPAGAGDHECPMHAAHTDHAHAVDGRHDAATGVAHERSVHHFLLYPDGGAIVLEALDATDTATIGGIRAHLAFVAGEFAAGRFDIPMFVHDRTPPGADGMTRLKAAIAYRFESIERGGAVRVTTADAEALAAVHAFLRFQIEDHRTGDLTVVQDR